MTNTKKDSPTEVVTAVTFSLKSILAPTVPKVVQTIQLGFFPKAP